MTESITALWRRVEDRGERLSQARRKLLDEVLSGGAGAVLAARDVISPRPAGESAPLSYAQERLWFLARLEPEDPAYNVPLAFELRGRLDAAALGLALRRLTERHHVLRSRFPEIDGEPRQAVDPRVDLTLRRIDLSALPAALRRDAALAEGRRLGRLPFDLESGPAVRTWLLRLDPAHHVLLINLHHVVSDAWSGAILRRELAALYPEALGGPPARLAALPIQYADYAVWQRGRVEEEKLTGELDFWRRTLEGAPDRLDLPFDRPRPATQSSRGGLRPLDLPSGLLARLQHIAHAEGVTLFVFLLAAFQTLLHRWTGAVDLVVGSPVAGRERQELEGLVGLFLNTLALRGDLTGDPPFRRLLRRNRTVVTAAQEHQSLPFERLVAELQPQRSLAHAPIFQVMLSFQAHSGGHGAAPRDAAMGGLEVERLRVDTGTAKFDLTLFLSETAERLIGAVEYNADLFDATTVERFGRQLGVLLRAAAASPGRRLSALPLLTAAQRHQLVVEWNDTPPPAVAPAVHERVVQVAAAAPSRPAVIAGAGDGRGDTLTYGELADRSARLAAELRRRGVGPGAVVALFVDRSPTAAWAILGTLRCGAACLPLDPSYPPARLRLMLEDAAAVVVLTADGRGGDLPPEWPGGVLELDDAAFLESAAAALPAVDPDDLAYVLYTSGSTGRPKGVAMTHRALANLVRWQLAGRPMEAGCRTLWFAPLSFDVSFQELFATWCGGGTLVTVSDEARRDPRELLALLDGRRVERLYLPFVALQNLALAGIDAGAAPGALREVFTAGEQLRVTPAVVDLFTALPGCRLHNQYGPTETHVVSEESLDGDPAAWPPLPAIGRPVDGLRLRVLDRSLDSTPPGVPGELYLGGAGLARGYLGRPGLTAGCFVPDPAAGTGAAAAGGRLYRTGDRARFLADGRVEFLGRVDDQVKVRGFRIEPGEVEGVLEAHPAVRAAAVTVRGSGPAERRLVAWVVSAEGGAPERAGLAAFLAGRLPSYMVPGEVRLLSRMPLTPSGKVDRRALGDVEGERLGGGAAGRAAESPEEELLASIWRRVLGVEEVRAGDDFFALGGHSLLATRVVSRVRETFGVELPLRATFEAPTLAGLARRLAALRRGDGAQPLPPVTGGAPRTGAPLSYAQERLWFMDRLAPGSPVYNLPLALRAEGPLDAGALAAAFAALVERHEVLRTSFREEGGEPVQDVGPPLPPRLAEVDLSALPGEPREAELSRLAWSEARRPFDLATGPVLRTGLVRLGDGGVGDGSPRDHAILVTLHHIAADGWSLDVLHREMGELYAAAAGRRRPALDPLPVQYVDFAAWQRRHVAGERLRRGLRHWRRRLAGAPELELPVDRPAPGRPGHRGGTCPFHLPEAGSRRLEELSLQAGATPFMTMLTAFFVLLGRWSGQRDLVVGTNVAGRDRLESEGLIGFFVNHLVLRADLGGEPTFRAVLEQVRSTVLDAYAHQEVPFDLLVRELAPDRAGAATPLFRVLFVMQNTGPRAGAGEAGPAPRDATVLHPLSTGWDLAKFDLALFVSPVGGAFRGQLSYRRELLDAATVERLAARYIEILTTVCARPDLRIDHMERMSDVEKTEIKKSDLSKLRSTRRRRGRRTPNKLVSEELPIEGVNLPLVVRPRDRDLALAGWAAGNKEILEQDLLRHGALMFRDWNIGGVAEFEAFARAVTDQLFGDYGDLPKEDEGEKVYHSTPYPADKVILFHNESSHMHRWPMRQFFHCVQAARERGETPIVDCREVYRELDPDLRQRFEEKKLMYVRNFVSGLDVSWQEFFKTDDRSEVEEYCRRAGLQWQWRGDDLQTRQIAPAVAHHPQTGEPVFFNQIQLHHKASLEADVRESMEQLFDDDKFPRGVRYGDGAPIPDEVVEEITRIYWDCSVALPWQSGDILMVDNMLVAHARNSFVGPRKIVVAMGNMLDSRKVA